MRFACYMPNVTDTHTLRICNIYCFSTETNVARSRPSVTLYVHCLSSFKAKSNFNRIRRPISQALNLVSFYSYWLRRRQRRVLRVLCLCNFSSSRILSRTTLFSPYEKFVLQKNA